MSLILMFNDFLKAFDSDRHVENIARITRYSLGVVVWME